MKKITLFLVLMFGISVLDAQDPIFLNTNQSLIFLNPSFAGSNGGIRNQASYRNQWPNLSGNFITYLNSFDAYIKPVNAGIAVSYLHDDIAHGTLKTDRINLVYAQHFNLFKNKVKIIPSLQLSYFRKSLDLQNLHFGGSVDARRGFVWDNTGIIPIPVKSNFDVSAGVLVQYNKNLNVGVSVFHINQPDEGLQGISKLPYRIVLHTSYNMNISEQTHLQLFYRYERQNNFGLNQFSANFIFFNHIILGVGYIGNDTPMINIGYRTNFLTLQLNYDRSVSKLAGYLVGPGAWELHASFNMRNKEQSKSPGTFENW